MFFLIDLYCRYKKKIEKKKLVKIFVLVDLVFVFSMSLNQHAALTIYNYSVFKKHMLFNSFIRLDLIKLS